MWQIYPPCKASGPDGIPNVVLQKSLALVEDHLLHLYQSNIRLGVYADTWREFTTSRSAAKDLN